MCIIIGYKQKNQHQGTTKAIPYLYFSVFIYVPFYYKSPSE